MNKVIIVGNIGQNPELKYTKEGMAVLDLSIATTQNWTDKVGMKQESTEWHKVVIFGKQAENTATFHKKGDQIAIEGSLKTESFEDKDGNKRSITKIKADRVEFLRNNRREENPADDKMHTNLKQELDKAVHSTAKKFGIKPEPTLNDGIPW